MKGVFLISAIMSIIAIIFICIFIFAGGIPFIQEYGLKNFLLGTEWKPSNTPASFGILPMILGSFYVTLGASHEKAIMSVVVPAARSGILSSIILGIGRAIGETMAVILVAGNQVRIPQGLTKGVRTLTTNIVIEMAYAADQHREALIATAAVLFIFILIINGSFLIVKRRSKN